MPVLVDVLGTMVRSLQDDGAGLEAAARQLEPGIRFIKLNSGSRAGARQQARDPGHSHPAALFRRQGGRAHVRAP